MGSYLHSERGNFKLFGFMYQLYLKRFELFGARLLKKFKSLKYELLIAV